MNVEIVQKIVVEKTVRLPTELTVSETIAKLLMAGAVTGGTVRPKMAGTATGITVRPRTVATVTVLNAKQTTGGKLVPSLTKCDWVAHQVIKKHTGFLSFCESCITHSKDIMYYRTLIRNAILFMF